MSQADIIKALKVKTAGLKRVHKELNMYEKDREKEQGKVDKLKASGADPHDIKQAVSGPEPWAWFPWSRVWHMTMKGGPLHALPWAALLVW